MTISDQTPGFGPKPATFARTGFTHDGNARRGPTPEEEVVLRDQYVLWGRRRRGWESRKQAPQTRKGAIRHRPACDRETLARLQTALPHTDHERAPSIVRKLAACVAGKTGCKLWACSRCCSERSHHQVERLAASFAEVEHGDLAAFTIILAAIGLNGPVSAETAAREARGQIDRLRQKAKRSGIDFGYWGQVELKIVETSNLGDSDHSRTTLIDLDPACFKSPEILVPHVHGFIRLGETTNIHEARRLLQSVFPASRQVVVKPLHKHQKKDKAVSAWARYSTKYDVKDKRKEPKKWFSQLLSGEHLMLLSIFQEVIKLRGGHFSYHLRLSPFVPPQSLISNDDDYETWLFSRWQTCRNDQLRASYRGEWFNIIKDKPGIDFLHYIPLMGWINDTEG